MGKNNGGHVPFASSAVTAEQAWEIYDALPLAEKRVLQHAPYSLIPNRPISAFWMKEVILRAMAEGILKTYSAENGFVGFENHPNIKDFPELI